MVSCDSAASTARTSASVSPSTTVSPSKRISPSVSVPVLSTQMTSTRARPSTAGSSCTSACRRVSCTAASRNASVVSTTRPSGTRPTMPAAVRSTTWRQPSSEIARHCDQAEIGSITRTTQVSHRRSTLVECCTSEWARVNFRASAASFCAPASAPTTSARYQPLPASTAVPLDTGSPADFAIASDSPVRFDSLSSRLSSYSTTPSAQTWSPGRRATVSPRTTWALGTSTERPSRSTSAVGACSTASESSLRFACHSWPMPSREFTTRAMPNRAFLYEPVSSTSTSSAPSSALKRVKTLALTISDSGRLVTSTTALVSPAATRASTSACVRPVSDTGTGTSTGVAVDCVMPARLAGAIRGPGRSTRGWRTWCVRARRPPPARRR